MRCFTIVLQSEKIFLTLSQRVKMTQKGKPRHNWEETAKQMHNSGDDKLLIHAELSSKETDWWTWDQ
jgi:hypothetical protein